MTQPRKVVITGVSRGLGRALADELIRRDCHVAGCARSEDAISELASLYGPPHHWRAVDVADWASVKSWAERVERDFGVPDLILNNAALVNRNAALWEVPPEEFSRVIDVNIKGVFHVIRAFAPAMIGRQAGVIVNFSSGWGRSVSPEVAPYCATKWAVEGLTRALAEELPSGMAAIPLNPGIINTPMLQSCFGAGAGSYPTPEQWIAKAAPYLLNLGPHDNGEPLTTPQ
jgi:NAD(P)-dependent dehydrogenase (short-subunit alcohol dehydrogenase family)